MLKRLFRHMFGPNDPAASADAPVIPRTEGSTAAAHVAFARELRASGNVEQARVHYKSALRVDPDAPQALFELGVLEAGERRYKVALTHFSRLADKHPGNVDAHNSLGNVYRLLGDWRNALRCYERALLLQPGCGPVLANLGTCLKDAGRLDEALAALDEAMVTASDSPEIPLNRATVLLDLGRTREAEDQLRLLLAAYPDLAEAHTSLSQILLQNGRFAEGWDEYEWRYRCADSKRQIPYPYPWWNGEEGAGRLLVRAEQGLGDQIMFASCLPDVMSKAATCMLECDERLVSLFRRSFPALDVHAKVKSNPARWEKAGCVPARQVLLSGLPRWFRRSRENFARHGGYLSIDEAAGRYWADRLQALGAGRKIGISWRGGAPQTRQSLRSIPLREWSDVLRVPAVHFVNLQYGDCADELHVCSAESGARIHHWPEALHDYDQTAALVAGLDLVISVQTSVVHLAGALGRPAWVAVPAAPEWRYMREGVSMPWYPSLALYRQDVLMEWAPVLRRIAAELHARE